MSKESSHAQFHPVHLDEFLAAKGWNLADVRSILQFYQLFGKNATRKDLRNIPVEELKKGTTNFAFDPTVPGGYDPYVPCMVRYEDGSASEHRYLDELPVNRDDRALVRTDD